MGLASIRMRHSDSTRHAHHFLRYERQCANALIVSEFLQAHRG